MKYWALSIFVFLTCFSGQLQAQLHCPSYDKINSVKDARADIDFIRNSLEKEHPNLYRYISKQAFDNKIDSLKSSLKRPVTNIALRLGIASVLSSIGDGHLSIRINLSNTEVEAAKAAAINIYPIEQFKYRVLQGRLYITGASETNVVIPSGAEVLSINGIAAAKMLADFFSVIPSDGYNQTFKSQALNMGLIPDLFTQLYGLKKNILFKVKFNDTERLVEVKALPRKTPPQPIGEVTSDFKLLPNGTGYLKIGSFPRMPFDGMPGQIQSGVMGDLLSPYASVFWRLSNTRTTSLILDLRNNHGGDFIAVTNLFSYLISRPSLFAKVDNNVLNDKTKTPDERVKYGSAIPVTPQSANFRGKLFVLVNGCTFSAASLLAANLQGLGNAVIIGEETGGGRNALMGGLTKDVTTPHSGMILQLRTVQMESPVPDNTEGRGVMPDIAISYSINEYLSGVDKELERAKSEIAKQAVK
ncbi:S41 family peptidase [Mucilaginibacter auburnensis]|uniref:Peptidase S41-like protein n=1 Tax=Mucilaginibacter auburnensis TaxID=1457233 RepID=A0A2H9VMZ8_9SPHI|nr:S41 family peptidase [Mucilaginibacter auburnensis]PJJ79696.1 peptidase S41-like protein [Mucilaginibacter auburnensis]